MARDEVRRSVGELRTNRKAKRSGTILLSVESVV